MKRVQRAFLLAWAALCQAQGVEQPSGPSVRLLDPPETLGQGSLLHLSYRCQGRQLVSVEIVASVEEKPPVSVFKRRWTCAKGAGDRVKVLRLDLPDRLAYQQDDVIQEPIAVRELQLQAWVSQEQWDTGGTWPAAGRQQAVGVAGTTRLFQPVSLLQRPFKAHPRTLRWDRGILWSVWKARGLQCRAPVGAEPLLGFVFASSGEKFGVLRTLEPHKDRLLEKVRHSHTGSPRCTITTWLFLESPCAWDFCGILHHLGRDHEYATPALLLTRTGFLHVQVETVSGQRAAVQSTFQIPLHRWCQVSLALKGSLVNLTTVCGAGEKTDRDSFAHDFPERLFLDDTEGRFVLGGSEFIAGIKGFLGPTYLYRSSVHTVFQVQLPELLRSLGLAQWFARCQRFKEHLSAQVHLYQLQRAWALQQESCRNGYLALSPSQSRAASPAEPQCPVWEAPFPRRRAALFALVRQAVWTKGPEMVTLEGFGGAFYRRVQKQLLRLKDLAPLSALRPRILQAACLGSSQAHYLISTLWRTGLGADLDPSKALTFSLLAAQADSRLSEMQLGHKHHLGVDGMPVDHDLAFAYYSNVASQTVADRGESWEEQAFVEPIRLTDEETLKLQTREDEDIFVWLRFQAKRGVAEAHRAVSRMLFWGQQGISRDVEAAVKFYENGATRLRDPSAMYDYGVVLLKGQGVKQDIPKALGFLNQAAEQGFPPALTALGWYHHVFGNDYRKAVDFWERADGLGDAEAASNLGAFYAYGLYPGKPKDEVTAYHYFWKSAHRGHVDGAVHLAAYLSRGIPGTLPRMPLSAVLWAKWVSEQNGFLGLLLRRSLDAYLAHSWPVTLLHYLLAAEAGLEVAQFNLAYLCDQDPGGLASRHLRISCPWRYYNLSTLSQQPPPYALLRMGDLLYHSAPRTPSLERDVVLAASVRMYKAAALQQEPQGLYSLGLLVEEGVSIPQRDLWELGLNASGPSGSHTLLLELYSRCRDHRDDRAFVPCTLALFSVHLKYLWMFHSPIVKFCGAAAAILATGLGLLAFLSRLRDQIADLQEAV